METKTTLSIILAIFLLAVPVMGNAQEIDYAVDLYRHGLSDDAKLAFIDILYDEDSTDFEKSESLYWLGSIAFSEGNFVLAKDDWTRVMSEFPACDRIIEIGASMDILQRQLTEISRDQFSSAVAESYIENGDFWCTSPDVFEIGLYSFTSIYDDVELGVYWYDRVITEFPDTPEAEFAYMRKLKALLGWVETGYTGYPYSLGALADPEIYMPQVVDTFTEFEAAFPDSIFLQAFRYQIAERYWYPIKDWETAIEWCNKLIDAANGEDTDYTQMAEWLLRNMGVQP